MCAYTRTNDIHTIIKRYFRFLEGRFLKLIITCVESFAVNYYYTKTRNFDITGNYIDLSANISDVLPDQLSDRIALSRAKMNLGNGHIRILGVLLLQEHNRLSILLNFLEHIVCLFLTLEVLILIL